MGEGGIWIGLKIGKCSRFIHVFHFLQVLATPLKVSSLTNEADMGQSNAFGYFHVCPNSPRLMIRFLRHYEISWNKRMYRVKKEIKVQNKK